MKIAIYLHNEKGRFKYTEDQKGVNGKCTFIKV